MRNDSKKVEYLGAYCTKNELNNRLDIREQQLAISISDKSDPYYIDIQKRDIELLKQTIDNFDSNAKIVTTDTNQTIIDYVLNEGYDDDGNYHDNVDSYKLRSKKQKQDNTPWQKGDDYPS